MSINYYPRLVGIVIDFGLSMENKGQWLKDLLDDVDMTPAELSRATGIDSAVISNIMNGRRGVGPDVAKKISTALKLPPETVYRMAGILPTKPSEDKHAAELRQIYEELNTGNREDLIDYARLKMEQQEREKKKSGKLHRTT
jgi:plasmid maintenance system antidote protein VapI